MLEIRNICKTYIPKNGVPVKALDNVSLAFEDTGMVFILGKSGSGKSTLLNVLGGLDQADSGEFIIKGKSSLDFTQSDFDSYRNTFIGFIFQEYNILEEFTVAQNIALAMELQGKRATSEALSEILAEVDLEGYGGRKPNELSGGQKQRVAIARALIKHPEMIMADEPTGALDSNTGKQVFETLKKLSKTKLVLIVSHDRDFAEQYADRIIELKDGQILSDVSKKNVPAVSHNEGVSVVDEKIIHIRRGYRLTAKDLELINGYMEKAESDALISIDGEKNPEIRKVVKINETGGKDAFLDTGKDDVKLKSYKPEDSRLIKSRLPYKNSLKIGASSLKAKPIRLIFTVLLCFVAFALFGIADTMAAYSRTDALSSSIWDGQIGTASFAKVVKVGDGAMAFTDVLLNDNDLAKIKEETGIKVIPVYTSNSRYYNNGYSLSSLMISSEKLVSANGISVYNQFSAGYAELTEEVLQDNGLTLLFGKMPTEDNEIAIPKFIYDQFALAGLVYTVPSDNDKNILVKKNLQSSDITGYGSIVGKSVSDYNLSLPNYTVPATETENEYESNVYTIVGIYDTKFDPAGFEAYMPDAERVNGASLGTSMASLKLSAMRDYGFHTVIAVNRGMLEKIINEDKRSSGIVELPVGIRPEDDGGYVTSEKDGIGREVSVIVKLSDLGEVGRIIWTDGEKSTLSDNEVLLPLSYPWDKSNQPISEDVVEAIINTFSLSPTDEQRQWLLSLDYNQLRDPSIDLISIIVGEAPENYLPSEERDSALYKYAFDILYNDFREENPYNPNHSGAAISSKIDEIIFVELLHTEYEKVARLRVDAPSGTDFIEYECVGFFVPAEGYDYAACVSDGIYSRFGAVESGDYVFALGSMPLDSRDSLDTVVEYSENVHGIVSYRLKNESSAILDYIGDIIETMSEVFLYIGIGFAVFASLMMFNFISVSVSYKKHEIGILRAVGARSSDVFGIFFNESLIITLINFILSSVATGVVCGILNNVFRGYGMSVTILNFGIRQIAMLLGLGVLVALVGSFIPVMNIARKRPIDAIRNK